MPATRLKIFISSVQKEFKQIRPNLKAFLLGDAGLPEPQFEQRGGSFVITPWRDWLTTEATVRLDLNDRQRQALALVKVKGRITNQDLREETGVVIRTISRDLEDLVGKGVLQKVGTTGRSIFYVLVRKPDTKRTNKT
jgi:predicted HTH transcriptional regulator